MFSNDAAYFDSKDLTKRKILKVIAYEIAGNCEYNWYQRALACMVYKTFDKKTGLGVSVNEQLAKELHKAVIKKVQKKKFGKLRKSKKNQSKKNSKNIWAADLAEVESLSSKKKNVKYLLCVENRCFH